jgi:hypothetical protein
MSALCGRRIVRQFSCSHVLSPSSTAAQNSRHDPRHPSPLPRLLCIMPPGGFIADAIQRTPCRQQFAAHCYGSGTLLRCLFGIAARWICQDGACENVKEMISSWRKFGLSGEPAERRHQAKQVNPIYIGARRSVGLSAKQ